MNEWLIVWLLVSHFVADFVFQSHETGTNKSKNEKILAKHIFTYTLVLWLLMIPTQLGIVFAILNGLIHWIVDWITSRLSSKFYAEKRFYAFWKVIGIDQLIHTCSLILTASIL